MLYLILVMKTIFTILLLFMALVYCHTESTVGHPNRILLRDVEVLTFKAGAMTSDFVLPQIICKGIYCNENQNYDINSIQCKNKGFDGNDINWKCETVVKNKNPKYEYYVSDFQVSCKGYEYPKDPYILVGSCNVEYTLDRKINKISSLQTKPNVETKTQTETITVTDHHYNHHYSHHHNIPVVRYVEYDDELTEIFLMFMVIISLALIIGWICSVAPISKIVYINTYPRQVYFWNREYYNPQNYYVPIVTERNLRRSTTTTTTTTSTNNNNNNESTTVPTQTDIKSTGYSTTTRR